MGTATRPLGPRALRRQRVIRAMFWIVVAAWVLAGIRAIETQPPGWLLLVGGLVVFLTLLAAAMWWLDANGSHDGHR